MTEAENNNRWILDLSKSLGLTRLDTTLLCIANKLAIKNGSSNASPLGPLLEFSFVSKPRSKVSFRYIINIPQWEKQDKEEILKTGFNSIAPLSTKEMPNPAHSVLDTLLEQNRDYVLQIVGAEHSKNTISSFKTYWQPHVPLKDILYLVPQSKRDASERLFKVIQALWSKWDSPRIVGVDFLSTKSSRVKVYFPPRDSTETLPLSTFCLLLVNLGLGIQVDNLTKVAYFCIGKRPEVIPTAFIVGVVLDKIPVVKLEVAAEAYFKNTEEVIKATSSLAISMGINPHPFYAGLSALQKHSPLGRPPRVEVVCIEFLPKGLNRMILYCRL